MKSTIANRFARTNALPPRVNAPSFAFRRPHVPSAVVSRCRRFDFNREDSEPSGHCSRRRGPRRPGRQGSVVAAIERIADEDVLGRASRPPRRGISRRDAVVRGLVRLLRVALADSDDGARTRGVPLLATNRPRGIATHGTSTYPSLLKRASVPVTIPVIWPEPDRRRLAAASYRDNQEEPS